jgi:hypothetical protein
MEQLPVVIHIFPAVGFWDDVVHFQDVSCLAGESASWTSSLLTSEEGTDACCHPRRMSRSRAPVHPVAVIGAASPLDVHLPFYRCLSVKTESELALRRRKVQRGAFSLPIVCRCPSPGWSWLSDCYPSADVMQKRGIYFVVGLFAPDACVVIAPAADDGSQGQDQLGLGCHFLASNDFSHLLTMLLDRFLAWGDDGLKTTSRRAGSVLSDGTPEKIASRWSLRHVERVGDPGFTWF